MYFINKSTVPGKKVFYFHLNSIPYFITQGIPLCPPLAGVRGWTGTSPSRLPPFLSFPYHRLYSSILPHLAGVQGVIVCCVGLHFPLMVFHPLRPRQRGTVAYCTPMAFILLWVAIQTRTNGVCPCPPRTRINKMKFPIQ